MDDQWVRYFHRNLPPSDAIVYKAFKNNGKTCNWYILKKEWRCFTGKELISLYDSQKIYPNC
jgi:hypothetical protein